MTNSQIDTVHHKARDDIDLSPNALTGLVEIVDDVLETITPKEESQHDQREKSIKP